MSDLDEFKATYFEECSELLMELEEQFTAIEEGDRDVDRLNAVFRAIHSVKGGAGAFGFDKLVEFAHSFETLLDFVRDGRVELSKEVITLCIRSIDLVADFVGAARDGEDLADDYGGEELARFKMLSGEDDDETMEEFDIEFVPVMVAVGDDNLEEVAVGQIPDGEKSSDDDQEADNFEQPPMMDENRYWKVLFTPHYELYERANDPLLLFRELSSLGETKIAASLLKLPDLVEFDPFGVYCSWEITITCDEVTQEAIEEVFEFVEGDCKLEITRVMAEPDEGLDTETVEELTIDDAVSKETAPEVLEAADEADEMDEGLSLADMAAAIEPAPVKETEKANSLTKKKNSGATKAATVQSIRVDLEKVDRVVNMVGELVITQSMLTQQMDDQLRARYQEMVRGVEVLAQTTRGLQDAVMAIRAQPVKSVFSRMPRLVRELSLKTGKNIRLEMVGEHTEIDKAIIEQLSDPLTHMIRNSADHGVETPEKRLAAGKSEQGIIRISAEQAGGNIIIAVEDDGAGINRVKVLELARERGVVGPDQVLSDEQIDELVFAPGFSTADAVSDISGRGVGMDVVISNIKKIGGSVHVRSSPGQGTKMLLRLPLTLAVLDVMLVEVGTGPYVIPLSSIVETVLCERADFGFAPSGRRVLQIRGEYVQVIDLAIRFEMETNLKEHKRFVVLCEGEGNSKIALIVDKIIGQQQVVIKSLEENFRRIDGIAGGTILGDGNVALIVDVQGLKSSPEQKSAA